MSERPKQQARTREVDALAVHWIGERLRTLLALRRRAMRKLSRELVHDLRVACRRLRATLALFESWKAGPAWVALDRAARRLAKLVAPLRELDVVGEALVTTKLSVPSQRRASTTLVRRWKRKRLEQEDGVRKRLRRQFRRLKRLAKEVAEPSRGTRTSHATSSGEKSDAEAWVGQRLAATAEEAQVAARAVATAPEDEALVALHRARVAVKHLRYTAEIAGDLAWRGAAAARASSSSLRKLQEAGGELQDLVDVVRRLERAVSKGHVRAAEGEALARAFLARREAARNAFVARLAETWPRR